MSYTTFSHIFINVILLNSHFSNYQVYDNTNNVLKVFSVQRASSLFLNNFVLSLSISSDIASILWLVFSNYFAQQSLAINQVSKHSKNPFIP